MTGYFRFVLRHRMGVVLACAAVTCLAGLAFSRAVVASSIQKMFFGDSPRYRAYQARARRFGNDELFIVGYPEPDPLGRESLARLERAVRVIKGLPAVARVHSLLDAQRVWSADDSLKVERYADLARGLPAARRGELLELLRRDRQQAGVLISADGRHASLIVELRVDPQRSAETIPRLIDGVTGALRRAGFDGDRLHLAGFPVMMSTIVAETYHNLRRLFPLSALALLITVLLIFRRLAPAVLATGAALLADVWTVGFASLLDRELNILVSMVPAVILVVSFSDVIHLWSAFQIELGRGKNREEAILASATDVGVACLLTSATTFVGFVCLSLVPTPMFRQMGLVLGFGVAVALLLAMTLVPIVLSVLPARRSARPPSAVMDRALAGIANLCTRRPWAITATFAALLALAVLGLFRLHIDTDMPERLSPKSRFRQDQRYFERHFSGTNTLEIYVDSRRPGGVLEPRLLDAVDRIERSLRLRPEVDHTVSLVTLIRTLHREITGREGLPRSREALAQYLLLFEMSGGEDLERLVDFKRQSLRVLVRTREHAVRATHETGLAAGREARRMLGGSAAVEPSGLVFLLGWWLDAIVDGQKNGLALSFALIALMMALGLHSLRVGLLSMVPNLLPLLALGGYLAVSYDRVDSDSLGLAMIALGIGVDDTIHFLMRFRIESRRAASCDEAIHRTFAFSGRAIVLTTVVLVAGFLPFATGSYFTTWMMGTLLPGVLVVALLADLFLVPALVHLGPLAFRRRG